MPAVSLAMALLFVSPWLPLDALVALREATQGWVQPTLVCAGLAGLVQVAMLLGPARQMPADIGWRPSAIPPALAVGVALWTLMQAPALLDARPLELAPAWREGLGRALGPLLAQVAATALVEETVCRGWLWPQLSARLSAHVMPRSAALLGALVSQAAFALLHVPVLVSSGAPVLGSLVLLFATGLVFVAVYAATGNLFIAVVIHALGNAPTLLAVPAPGAPAPTMPLLIGTLVLVAIAVLRRRLRR